MTDSLSKDTLSIDPDIADLLQMRFNGRVPGYEELAEAYLKAATDVREAQQLCMRQAQRIRVLQGPVRGDRA